jgi:hypothetical protein
MTPAQWALAIACVESGNNPNVGLGDDSCAFGAWQMHPAFLWEWATDLKISPTVNETLYSWQNRIAMAFYTYHQTRGFSDVEIAVMYHLGHIAQPSDSDWNDENYPERFTRAAAALPS